MSLRIESAPALRDAGIVATAVLDRALAEALGVLPVEVQQELKRGIGRAMAAVLEETVERAVRAHPQLEPDEATWAVVAGQRQS